MSVDAGTPVTDTTCKTRWVMTVQNADFGSFSSTAGGTLQLLSNNSVGTATGSIDHASAASIVSSYTVTIDNTLSPTCGTFGIDLNWNIAPSDLIGTAPNMTLSNIQAEYPAGVFNTLPVTGLTPGTLPVSIPFRMLLTSTGSQTSGVYTSGAFSVDLTQSGANTTSPDATATATVFTPLSIVETVALDFGTVAGGPLPGTVILDPINNNRTPGGDASVINTGPGLAGSFQITGEANQVYSVSYADGSLDDSGTGTNMSITSFVDTSSGIIPATNTETFQVGATLNIGANQPAGVYSTMLGTGTPYTVTINYN